MADLMSSAVNSLALTPPSAGEAASTPDPSKVKDLATQFEGMLMTQMMKDLKLSLGGEDDDAEKGSDIGPLGDVMTQELGLALSRAGGFGMGSYLTAALAKQAPVTPTNSAMTFTSDMSADAPAAEMEMPAALPVAAPSAAVAPTSMTSTSSGARVSSPFGWRADPIDGSTKFHKGMDVAVASGTTVYAPADGKVVSVGQQTGYGLTVVVQHANGVETKYAHLSAADVRPGDAVTAGTPLAQSGNTGRSTGAHLHFEVVSNGQAVDPSGWVDAVVSGPAATRPQATR